MNARQLATDLHLNLNEIKFLTTQSTQSASSASLSQNQTTIHQMKTKLINFLFTFFVFFGGFLGTLSVGYYFFWGETRHGGEYPMALAYHRKYLKTGDRHLKEEAEIHRRNADTLGYWGFLSAKLMLLALIGLKINNKSEE